MSPSSASEMSAVYSSLPSDGLEALVAPPHLPAPIDASRPRSAGNSLHRNCGRHSDRPRNRSIDRHSDRHSDHDFPVLPPAPGPAPFAPLPVVSDASQCLLSRSRSQQLDQASKDVFHNISNIDATRSGGAGGGSSTHGSPNTGKSVIDGKGGKVTSFGVGPAIAPQSLTYHTGTSSMGGGSHRGDGGSVLSRASAGTGPRTTLSNTQNGYTHAPRPPSSLGTQRSLGEGGSFVMTPESHPLASLPHGSESQMGLRDEREGVVAVPRGNGIGRNRVGTGRTAPLDPRQLMHYPVDGDYGRSDSGRDSGRESGAGSSLDEGPKTPATNMRMTLATPAAEGVVGRDLKGVQAKECVATSRSLLCSRRTCTGTGPKLSELKCGSCLMQHIYVCAKLAVRVGIWCCCGLRHEPGEVSLSCVWLLHSVCMICSACLLVSLCPFLRLTAVVSCCSMYKEAIAARSQAARVLMSKSHLPPR